MQQASCPLCDELITHKDHFRTCKNAAQIRKIAKHAIHFDDQRSLCCKCFSLMKSNQYMNHNRNCARRQKKLSSTNSERLQISSLSIASKANNSTISKDIKQPLQIHALPQPMHQSQLDSVIYTHCQRYLIAYLKPHLLSWLQKYSNINSIVLFKIFQRYTKKIVQSLQLALPNIQLTSVYQLSKKINWKRIVTRIQDIYNKQIILNRIAQLSQAQQNAVMKALNKIYLKYSGIFELFNVSKQAYIPKNPREKKPLLPAEFLQVLNALFATQKIGFINIALELMIIYQSGQRFPSSLEIMQESINRLLRNRKTHQKQNSFLMISTKTQSQQNVIFDQQLIQLLQSFGWRKFSQNKRFYERLSQYFPFSCYSLRRGFICYMYLAANNDASSAIRLLTNHKNEKNVNYYIRSLIKSIHLQVKARLRIPNSKIMYASKKELLAGLPQYHAFTDKIQLHKQWFNQSFYKLKDITDMTECDCLQIKEVFTNPQQVSEKNEQADIALFEEEVGNSSQGQSESQIVQVMINGKKMRMYGKQFKLIDQYQQVAKSFCHHCLQQLETGYCCSNCGDHYHIQCISQTFCACHVRNFDFGGIALQNTITLNSEIKLKMPEKYFGIEFENLKQIQFLIFMRGFNFTNTSVPTQNCKSNITVQMFNQLSLAQINLPKYFRYERYQYFPPLQLILFGQSNNTGSGFGLCASEDINQLNVFLGQYAGDVFFNTQYKFVQRKDMIMQLQSFKTPSKCLSIAPIRFAGYVMLVNESKKPNCAVVKAKVNGKYKILLYNTQKIKKGTQLFYDYGRLQNSQQWIEQAKLQKKMDLSINLTCILISNLNNNCYLNTVLQMFWKLKQCFDFQRQISSSNKFLSEFQTLMNFQSGLFSPEKLMAQLFDKTDKFMPGRQQDAHQLFDFILEQFDNQRIDTSILKSMKKLTKQCAKCSRIEVIQFESQLTILEKCRNPFDKISIKQSKNADHICPQCSEVGTTLMKEEFVKYSQVLIFLFNRFIEYPKKSKDQTKIMVPLTFKLYQFQYKRVALILHKGKNRTEGHYTFIDEEQNIEISDTEVKSNFEIQKREIYMIVFKQEALPKLSKS